MGTKKIAKKGILADWTQSAVSSLKSLRSYLKEVVYELRKVVWPSKKQTVGTTAVVIIVVMIFGIYLGIIDSILSWIIRHLVG